MPFRSRQKFHAAGLAGFAALEMVDDVDPDGVSVVHIFNPHNAVLPDGSMFDLVSLVKAKVPLEATRTKILGGDTMAIADALNDYEEPNIDEQSNKE